MPKENHSNFNLEPTPKKVSVKEIIDDYQKDLELKKSKNPFIAQKSKFQEFM